MSMPELLMISPRDNAMVRPRSWQPAWALALIALSWAAGSQANVSGAAAPAAVSPSPAVLAEPPALLLPVQGMKASALRDTFSDQRGGNEPRGHEALDMLAPTGTPVLAVDDGRIAKLFLSKPGGITIYQFNPSEQFAYYYAHLDRYADGLAEGQSVKRGTVIGYVGATGNANPNAPHLHFAIFCLGPEKQWWKGEPINPFGYLGGIKP